eukprot:CAMPEP_0114563874 /NCGR_PEP_ID=MMETSP0114-20121206/13373_1 /TAXON_ID=31324 /ORGANISM="Goniomonas sp, Strain m" /LENGTH=398 /DNA_ID=CAMNT_0001749811 /DNA_START=16 /DNA_END=1213 /DNA_ORIENTATION=-
MTTPSNVPENLSACLHLPFNEAASALGICSSSLKKLCQQHGISHWPQRKMKAPDKRIWAFHGNFVDMLQKHDLQSLDIQHGLRDESRWNMSPLPNQAPSNSWVLPCQDCSSSRFAASPSSMSLGQLSDHSLFPPSSRKNDSHSARPSSSYPHLATFPAEPSYTRGSSGLAPPSDFARYRESTAVVETRWPETRWPGAPQPQPDLFQHQQKNSCSPLNVWGKGPEDPVSYPSSPLNLMWGKAPLAKGELAASPPRKAGKDSRRRAREEERDLKAKESSRAPLQDSDIPAPPTTQTKSGNSRSFRGPSPPRRKKGEYLASSATTPTGTPVDEVCVCEENRLAGWITPEFLGPDPTARYLPEPNWSAVSSYLSDSECSRQALGQEPPAIWVTGDDSWIAED